MKFLLVAVNAKYIHSNPAVYSLKLYAEQRAARLKSEPMGDGQEGRPGQKRQEFSGGHGEIRVETAEYTINHRLGDILEDIYRRQPDMVGFSCYIWNIREVLDLVRDLHKVLPDTDI